MLRSGVITRSVQPPLARMKPSSSTAVSSARTTVVPTATSCIRGQRARIGNVVTLRKRVFARLETRHAGVQHEWRDTNPFAPELLEELVGKCATGRRHFGAAGLVGKYRLVILEWPGLRHVRVSDRGAVLLGVVEGLFRQPELGDPKSHSAVLGFPATSRVRRDQTCRCTGGQTDYLVRLRDEERAGSAVGSTPYFDDPRLAAAEESGREVEHDIADGAIARFTRRHESGVDGSAGVDDEDVTAAQQIG